MTLETKATKLSFKGLIKNYLPLSILDGVKSIFVLTSASLISLALRFFTEGDINVSVIFVLSVVVISRITMGYLYGILSSIIGVFIVNYLFTYPFLTFNFTISGYPLTFASMLIASLVICALTTQIKEQAKQALLREQHTKALYDINQRLSKEQDDIRVQAEKEKMRGNLLRAVSHDFRTPLTSIIGASSAILENDDMLSRKERDKLIFDIKEDAQWLIRLVENLLSITRISEGATKIQKQEEAIEEIVAEAVGKIKKRYSSQQIQVRVPDELLMVPMDATLIEQVIINLLENAIIHSKRKDVIDLSVSKQNEYAVFEVRDRGKGIQKEDLPHLFEGYLHREKSNSDSSRGMGIGLSVCMSIIKAHDGQMEAENNLDCGVTFRFMIPIKGDGIYG